MTSAAPNRRLHQRILLAASLLTWPAAAVGSQDIASRAGSAAGARDFPQVANAGFVAQPSPGRLVITHESFNRASDDGT
jgi:hypothetical protein